MYKQKKGFTLIELMVVVLILGILTIVGVPMFIRSVEESRSSEATTNLGAYAYAQERHHVQFGSYTNDPSQLDMAFVDFSYFTITQFGQKMTLTRKIDVGGDLHQWSISMTLPDPPGTNPYFWECSPMPACKYLLPSNIVGGVIQSTNN